MIVKRQWIAAQTVLKAAALAFALLPLSVVAQRYDVRVEKCRVDRKIRADFEVVTEHRNSLPPFILGVDIVVKENNYNEAFMTRLARHLTAQYCHDNQVSVVIFDNKAVAKKTDMWNYLLGKVKVPEVRGFYGLNREKKIVSLQFSSKRGGPTAENKISVPVE